MDNQLTPRQQLDQHFRLIPQQQYEQLYVKDQSQQSCFGSTCEVFKAKDMKNNRVVALKQYNRSQMKNPLNQIQTARQIQNFKIVHNKDRIISPPDEVSDADFIIELYDCLMVETQNYIYYVTVTQYCEGGCLKNRLLQISQKGDQQKIRYCKNIVQAVRLLHRNNILHRDIKPENIFIAINQQGQMVMKLGDLGSSKVQQTSMTLLVGTLLYIDPRSIETQNYGKQYDIYALGLTFHEIFTGLYILGYEPTSVNQLLIKISQFLKKGIQSAGNNLSLKVAQIISKSIGCSGFQRIEDINDLMEIITLYQEENQISQNIQKNNQIQVIGQKNSLNGQSIDLAEIDSKKQRINNLQYQEVQTSLDFKKKKENMQTEECISSQESASFVDMQKSQEIIPHVHEQIRPNPFIRSSKNFSDIPSLTIYQNNLEQANKSVSQVIISDSCFDQDLGLQSFPKATKLRKKSSRTILPTSELPRLLLASSKLEKNLKSGKEEELNSFLAKQCEKLVLIKQISKQMKIYTVDRYIVVMLAFMFNIASLKYLLIKNAQFISRKTQDLYTTTIQNHKKMAAKLYNLIRKEYPFYFKKRKWLLQTIEHEEIQAIQEIRDQFLERLGSFGWSMRLQIYRKLVS